MTINLTGGLPPEKALMETLEWPALPALIARLLADDERRDAVAAFQEYVEEPDEELDRLTRLAALALGMPMSAVTLIEPDRQVFAGQSGFAERSTALDRSYCKYATAAGRTMAIRDATKDRILRDNPATLDGVRAYLGVPIFDREGHALGTVCAFGTEPHTWTPRDVAVLNIVSHAVVTELELRAERAKASPRG
jgi:GAF domain-containing protein